MIKSQLIIYHSTINQRAHRRNLVHGITSKKIHYDKFRDRSKIQYKTLKFLRKHPSQITFNVIFFGIHNTEFLNFVKKLNNLRKIQLHFPGSQFGNDSIGLQYFKKRFEKRISRHKRLTHLHIEWISSLPPDQKFIQKIASLRNLKTLQFEKIPDDPNTFTVLNTGLGSIYKRNTWPGLLMQDFHFYCNTIYYEMMIGDIQPLSDAVNLFMEAANRKTKTYLRLGVYWENADTGVGYINLSLLIKEIRECLTHLEITGRISEASLEKYFSKNPVCNNLRTLKISARDPLEPASLHSFLNRISSPDILSKIELPISLTKKLPEKLLTFNYLQNLKNLRIDFGSNQNWTRQLFSEFSASLTNLPHLLALHISFIDEFPAVLISQEDHTELFEAISKLQNLKKFSLLFTNRRQNNPLIIEGLFASISMALRSLTNLTHLNLDFSCAPRGVPFLIEAFPFLEKLEKLNLFLTKCETGPEVFMKLLESLSSQRYLTNVKMRYDLWEINDWIYKAVLSWTEKSKFLNRINVDLKATVLHQGVEKKMQDLASQLGKRMIANLNCQT